MLKKKNIVAALACVLALGAWSGSTLATPINVNGVYWDTSNPFDLTIQSLNLRETSVSVPGDTLHGYGQIGSINGNNSFCSGCDLTFTFTYKLLSVNGNQVAFDNGSYQFYTQAAGTFNFGNPSSVGGTPWVTLSGHTFPAVGYTETNGQLYATITGTVSNPTNAIGTGLVDATSGPAWTYLNSNSVSDGIGGFADFNLVSSFSTFPAKGCGTTPTTDLGNICSYPIQGNGSLVGKSVPVPEPGAAGLLGLGLAFLGLLTWRRRKEGDGQS